MSISCQTDNTVVYPNNGVLLTNEQAKTTDTHNIDNSQKLCQKNPDTKGYMQHDSIYKSQKRQTIVTERSGVATDRRVNAMGYQVTSEGNRNVLHLDCGDA